LPLASLHPPTGDGTAGFVAAGAKAHAEAGSSVSDAGDVNGDGIGDVVISAKSQAYVVFGRATAR
jgi:hypothetical protein